MSDDVQQLCSGALFEITLNDPHANAAYRAHLITVARRAVSAANLSKAVT